MSKATDDFLEHHGVRGMKWGVRRNSSSSSGKSHASTGGYTRAGKESADARHVRLAQEKIARGGVHTLNNKELQALVQRQNLEQQYRQLNPKKVSEGKKLAIQALATLGPIAISAALASRSKYAPQVAPKAVGNALALYNPHENGKRVIAETLMKTGGTLAKQYGPKVAELMVKSLIGA
jgi:hypothetical protein